jgi:copper(I)-binding protein
MIPRGVPFLSLALALSLVASCAPTQAEIHVSEAWARPAGVGENSAVYFQIENRGQSDRLVEIYTEASQDASFHRTLIGEDGIAQMQAQSVIEVPAREKLAFEPGGYHVMLMRVTQNLSPGRSFSVTLVFENAGPLLVEVPIQTP